MLFGIIIVLVAVAVAILINKSKKVDQQISEAPEKIEPVEVVAQIEEAPKAAKKPAAKKTATKKAAPKKTK